MSKNILRGEIWVVNFDPQVGAEIQKKRPAVVINMRNVSDLPLHIIVPITKASDRKTYQFWMVDIKKNPRNMLNHDSFADASQVKSISVARFDKKLGVLDTLTLNEVVAAVVLCIGYTPPRH